MHRASRGLAALLLLVSAVPVTAFAQTPSPVGAPLLRLRSGKHYASSSTSALAMRSTSSAHSAHFIAVFQTVPDAADAAKLRALGYRVLSFVPDNGLLVYGNPAVDLSAAGVLESYMLQTGDKLSARLVANSPAKLSAVVELQPDADVGLAWLRLLMAGIVLLPNQDLNASELLVRASSAALREIAGWDDVASVFPAAPQMTAGQKVVPCAMGYSGRARLPVAANLVPTFGEGWAGAAHGSAVLTYILHSGTLPEGESDVRSALQSVLAEWSAYAAITFTPAVRVDANGSIDILFASGDHGDGFPFLSSGPVLAHTFYPPPNPEPIAGDVHMNRDEPWSMNGSLQLYPVMLHEMGHALGLGHSDNPSDVMYPYYQGAQHLAAGDIEALRTLYAAPVQPVNPTPPGAPTNPDPPATPVNPTPPAPPATPPANSDATPPLVRIYSPSVATPLTSKASITVQGFATDHVGVTRIAWSNSAGGSGTAGVANPFTIPGIALVPGVNRIWIQAYDAAGNRGSAYLTVTRK